MRRALALAKRGSGRTAPNPMVGALIVREGAVLSEGWHVSLGQSHGETAALAQLEGSALGATMFVNLEPCCHHGRTPPCTDAVIASGIANVVVGTVDPDPRVSGRGIALMRAAGIHVSVGIEEAACRALNGGYFKRASTGLPRVWLKAGCTLDGRIADASGASQWITGPQARSHAHRLRDRFDAVMVGSGTLIADDPSLNTRVEHGRDALPVLLDSRLRCPAGAKVLTAGRRPRIYCALDAPERDLPADIVRVPRARGGLDLGSVLRDLAGCGVLDVLVEGGGQVHRALLADELADRLLLFIAPKVLAGGPGFVGGEPLSLGGAFDFQLLQVERFGQDLMLDLAVR
jgi:diaminohydroxyphosphoribosylaminopyrimidine deaminase/5-amino-6-(5-phosphoribosylamino)uracil reductase